jgi:ATP-dependent helicase HrpB
MEALPIDPLVQMACSQLSTAGCVVLTAPPGSGKSTRIPPAVARGFGRTYLLQPRRIAAKALATRIAHEQQWRLGNEIGYRVRFERVGSEHTRLWVMTEGSLTRQLQSDPYLDGVAAVILDEFHERSLHLDLALGYLRELQRSVRPELKLIVMSATLDAGELCRFLDCPLLEGAARMHPVVISHASDDLARPLEDRVAAAVVRALAQEGCGDVLAFLPGAGEIRACERELAQLTSAEILPLHGQLPPQAQERALSPQVPGGRPRVILATNVAETSLTIPGVATVIDSGLVRTRYDDPASGIEELRLEPISRQSATQRAGRAGRTAPGRCVRLWSLLQDQQLPETTLSEVRRLDLSSVSLALKRLDYRVLASFPWFEAPERARLDAATALLALLGAGGEGEALSALGQRLAALPLAPRLGRLLIAAAHARVPRLGASLAALCAERDIRLRPQGASGHVGPLAEPAQADALERLELLEQAEQARHQGHLRSSGIDPQASQTVVRVREELLQAWRSANPGWQAGARESQAEPELVCQLLLCAFPDRVARRALDDPNRCTMVGGVVFEIDRASALYVPPQRGGAGKAAALPGSGALLVAVDVQRAERAGRSQVVLRQGAEISEAMIEALLPGSLQVLNELAYDPVGQRVANRRVWRYRGLTLREASAEIQDPSAAAQILSSALAVEALALIQEDAAAASLLQRLAWLRALRPDLELPAIDLATAQEIIQACCAACTTRDEVQAKPKAAWLLSRLSRAQGQALENLAPQALQVPSGASIRLDYSAADAGHPPVLAVRLQELFGLRATPRLGTVPVLLHLLAPNYRVEQVTTDLASFWANTYQQVRKDLRGRYPKHSWPEDPLTAQPLARGPSVKRS